MAAVNWVSSGSNDMVLAVSRFVLVAGNFGSCFGRRVEYRVVRLRMDSKDVILHRKIRTSCFVSVQEPRNGLPSVCS